MGGKGKTAFRSALATLYKVRAILTQLADLLLIFNVGYLTLFLVYKNGILLITTCLERYIAQSWFRFCGSLV
jgi:hypothetical protein